MNRLFQWGFSVLLAFGLSGLNAEELSGLPSEIRVATWNVENYLVQDRSVEGRYRRDYPKPEREKAALREILLTVRPDILLLQEMGTDPFLEELQRDLKALGLDYPHRRVGKGNDEVRHLAILSRFPWEEQVVHDDLDFSYFEGRDFVKRGLLETRFLWGGETLTVYGLHLKSRWTERPDDPEAAEKRRREARASRDRIQSRTPVEAGGLVLVAGDFNDSIDSSAVRHFLNRGETTLAHRLRAEDSRGESWTHHFARPGVYSTVDHILVSPALLPLVSKEVVLYDALPGARVASDHRLLYVDLKRP